jgi:hypothetical protein
MQAGRRDGEVAFRKHMLHGTAHHDDANELALSFHSRPVYSRRPPDDNRRTAEPAAMMRDKPGRLPGRASTNVDQEDRTPFGERT